MYTQTRPSRPSRFSAFKAIILCLLAGLLARLLPTSLNPRNVLSSTWVAVLRPTLALLFLVAKIHEDALQIIKDVAGTQLDAELVKYFLIIPKERLFQCTPEQEKY